VSASSQPHGQSTPQPTLRDPLLWGAMLTIFAMLAWLSLARYWGFNAGMFDLGNMAQAIWSSTQGKPLLYSWPSGVQASRLGGHVELGYLLFTPLYALIPDPQTLLVAQAGLFVVGALGAYRLAARRTGDRFAARAAMLIYLLYPAALTGVLFDFHADTIALPILMLALDALDQRAWRRYALLIAIALSLKFYIAASVAGIGLIAIVWGGQRRAGALTITAALLYGGLAFFVLRPLFSGPGSSVGTASGSYIGYYFGQLDQITATLGERALNALIVFGPVLLVAWRGWRWLIPGLPIAAAALLSTGPGGAFDYRYHHYGVAVPFIIMAAIDGVGRMQALPRRRGGRSWRGDLGLTVGVTLLCAALLVDIPLNPLFWLRIPGSGLDSAMYGVTERDQLKPKLLARIPVGAPVVASNFLAPHLANRSTLYLLRYPDEAAGPRRLPTLLPQAEYAIADALFDFFLPIDGGYAGGIDGDREAIGLLLNDPAFGLIGMQDGLLLFQRSPAASGLQNQISERPDDGTPAIQVFGDAVELVSATIETTTPGRAQLHYIWRVRQGFGGHRYVAISQIAGIPEARFVHLPGYVLSPSWQWQPGTLVEEHFEIELPEGLQPGDMQILTGWYDFASPFAYRSDPRSLLPGSEQVETAMLAGVSP
jgi:uncharacterized membrane protein